MLINTQPSGLQFQVGNTIFTDLVNLISLIGITQVFGASGNCGLRNALISGSGYQVTAGKTLNIYAIRQRCFAFTTAPNIALAYADNDVGLATNTALTNGVYAGNSTILTTQRVLLAVGNEFEASVRWKVPAGKYPTIVQGAGSGNFVFEAFGYET